MPWCAHASLAQFLILKIHTYTSGYFYLPILYTENIPTNTEGPHLLTAGKYGEGALREAERWVLLELDVV